MIYTHVLNCGGCGEKSPLDGWRKTKRTLSCATSVGGIGRVARGTEVKHQVKLPNTLSGTCPPDSLTVIDCAGAI
jgi:hypothetical protein